ncbi:MAG: hypothetical protein HYZ34_15065 [Ignavibacteriae bacterium]|nr:hypothetical protein [Ignavibacteriota bacterium]
MNYVSLFLALLILFLSGCEPLSLPDEETERDVVADVLAMVTPDTVLLNSTFSVQLGFPNVCGGTFKRVNVTYDTLYHVFLQPIIHKVPQEVCPAVYEVQTVTSTVKLTKTGVHQIVAIGNFGSFRKDILVVDEVSNHGTFRFAFRFQNRGGQAQEFYSASLRFLNQLPDGFLNFTTDDSGIWDTTFTHTSGTLQFIIGNGFQFTSTRGVTESGIIIIP